MKQHHVARVYLRAWANGERIWCLRSGKIFCANLMRVGVQRNFYRIPEITEGDEKLLRSFVIEQSPRQLQPLQEKLVRYYRLPFKLRKHAERTKNVEALNIIDTFVTEGEEKSHSSMESDLRRYLLMLQERNTEFWRDDRDAANFSHILAMQYVRTVRIRELVCEGILSHFETPRRVVNLLAQLIAINIGFSLYRDRKLLKLIVRSTDGTELVTADQPWINLSAVPEVRTAPTAFNLYYPVSPTTAMFLLEDSNGPWADEGELMAFTVSNLNLAMSRHSLAEVFATSESTLKSVRDYKLAWDATSSAVG